MKKTTFEDLQESIKDNKAFQKIEDYSLITKYFLDYLSRKKFTKIVSPTDKNYIFYQYDNSYNHQITRPLNSDLFIQDKDEFSKVFERFLLFLGDLKKSQLKIMNRKGIKKYLQSNEINKAIYTAQQSIGCIGDSLHNSNQSRKRIGQIFECLIRTIISSVGLECEPRTIKLQIPQSKDCLMSYELDIVVSRNKAVITSETKTIHENEFVGSIKTTSKDRIDKIFLDKYLLTKFLGRDIPVIAIFLHDVQRAKRGNSIFGINSTFKTNHFLVYTFALNRLDGVYYIDRRPAMKLNAKLDNEIKDFQQFLIKDLWLLSK